MNGFNLGGDTHLHTRVEGENSIIKMVLILISHYSISGNNNGGIVMNPPACFCVDGNNIIVNFTLMISNNNLERSWFYDAIIGKV